MAGTIILAVDLLLRTDHLRGREKKILHELLLYFGEVDERQLYRGEAYSSMFTFLTEKYGYSEGGACRRIKVARCIRKHPAVHEALCSGDLLCPT